MPKPTHVATYLQGSAGARINGTLPKTYSVTCAVGDRLLCWASMADNAATVSTPTGGTAGLTWTLIIRDDATASNSGSYFWASNSVTTAGTFTLTHTKTGGTGAYNWASGVVRWSSCTGFGTGVRARATGTPSLALTTVEANSAIMVLASDWNAVAGGSRVWRTPSGSSAIVAGGAGEVMYEAKTTDTNNSTLTTYVGYHDDAGATGSKTVGLSAPLGQKYTIIAVEVKGSAVATTGGDHFPFMQHHQDELSMRRNKNGLFVPKERELIVCKAA